MHNAAALQTNKANLKMLLNTFKRKNKKKGIKDKVISFILSQHINCSLTLAIWIQ